MLWCMEIVYDIVDIRLLLLLLHELAGVGGEWTIWKITFLFGIAKWSAT